MFGGEISAGLVGGIMHFDAAREIGVFDTTTPVRQRVFFLGIQGGFKMAGIGRVHHPARPLRARPAPGLLNVEIPDRHPARARRSG